MSDQAEVVVRLSERKGRGGRRSPSLSIAFLFCSMWGQTGSAQTPLGTAITYQGRLTDAGSPATGSYDMQFTLYDAATGGAVVGAAIARSGVAVTSGLFTVSLDFGPSAFEGSKRWLEIGVKPAASGSGYTPLAPRQELTPAPNAVFAAKAANATTVAGLACLDQQVAKWSGSVWTCGADADTNSGGTVTSVVAGTGLSGGTLTTTGTVAVNFGGNGAASTVARSDHNHTGTYLPASVSSCAAGSTIQTINADGTVVCQTAQAQPGFSTATIHSTPDVGSDTSITIGTDGLGLISYYDSTNGDLKVAHCSNPACTTATTATLDGAGNVGSYTSITIGTDGLGLISYQDVTSGDMKVAHCTNTACTAATTTTLDSTGSVGFDTSITIGTDGLGLISHFDVTNGDLRVAHCSNTACTTATTATLDSAGTVGQNTSITIGTDGLGLISYYDQTNVDLKVAHCSNTACSAATTTTLDSTGNVGSYTSIAIGADGLGLISYRDDANSDLKVAHCSDTTCTIATAATLDSTGLVGFFTSITIGTDGLGFVSYFDASNADLKVAHCSNTACTTAATSTLDSTGFVGGFTSITIGTDGLGLISYFDNTNSDLKVAHCSNALCQPNVRRR